MNRSERSTRGIPSAEVVSVIVPVYNVEEYLDECVCSILQQSHESLDVILVDDGSTDRSGHICDLWGARDRRVRVVHKANGGPGSARNAGLELARGDYITFVDSDDVTAPDLVASLVEVALAHRADLVVSDFVGFSTGRPAFSREGPVSKVGTGSSLLPDVVCDHINWGPCEKLFASSLFDGGRLRFAEDVVYEDVEFAPKAFVSAGVAVLTPWRLYGYRQRPQSIMGMSSGRVSPDLITMLRSAISTVQGAFSKDDPAYEDLLTAYILHASKKLEWMDPADGANDDFRRAYRGFIRDNWAAVARLESISLAYRAGLLLSMVSPRGFSRIVSRLRRLKGSVLGRAVRRSRAGGSPSFASSEESTITGGAP